VAESRIVMIPRPVNHRPKDHRSVWQKQQQLSYYLGRDLPLKPPIKKPPEQSGGFEFFCSQAARDPPLYHKT
jgi:hypothetical protein